MKGFNLIIGVPGAYRNRVGHTLGFRLVDIIISIYLGSTTLDPNVAIFGYNLVDPNLY